MSEGTLAQVLAGEAQWCVITGDNGPVLEAMPAKSVDHVITDPPYGERTHANAVHRADKPRGIPFAALLDPARFATEAVRVAARWVVAFGEVEQMGAYASAGNWVRAGVWDKVNPTPQLTGDRPGQAVEAIAILHREGRKRWNRGGSAAIWRYPSPRGSDRPDHPTPKPLDLMLALVADFTDPADLILDPYCGSGTTGVAALRLGRRCIMIEREPKWAELARERCRAEESGSTLRARQAGQIALFGGGK